MIEITESAADKIKEYFTAGLPEEGSTLRIKVVGGGCSGLKYELAFDKDINSGVDHLIEEHGVRVIIDERSALYMVGTVLEYTDTLMDSGFKINNPNATNTCGCGESFAA
jgi:iron-sulfur cluster assembly protein